MRKIVLLPEPFGPSRPTISPGAIAKDTSLTARRGPYHLVRCCASTTGAVLLTIACYSHMMSNTMSNTRSGAQSGMSLALDDKAKNGKQTRANSPGLPHQATGLSVAYS